MSTEPYLLITGDTHAGGSHAQYREYLDPQDRERFDEWRGRYKNPSKALYDHKKHRNWDTEIRAKEQDSQGVVGEVIFPNTVPPFFRDSIVTCPPPRPEEYEGALAGVRAHNRWLKDFVAEDPARRAGIGLILPNDLDEAIKDIEFIAKAGLRGGLLLPIVPPDYYQWVKPLYHADWDRVFAAIQDHDLVMNNHAGQGPSDHAPYASRTLATALYATEFHFTGQTAYRQLLISGVFERFPKLKFIITESGCSWVKDVLSNLDSIHGSFTGAPAGEMEGHFDKSKWHLKNKPSETAKQHCYYGASFPSREDLIGVEEQGEDHVLWGNDYPHYEGTHPYTWETIRYTFSDMPDARRRKLLGLNAAKLYKFDVEKLKPMAAKYGPTPEQLNAPFTDKDVPRDSTCWLWRNVVSQKAA